MAIGTDGRLSEDRRRRALGAAISSLRILGIYTLVATLFALEYYFFNLRAGAPKRPLYFYVVWTLPGMYSWAVLTPFILAASRRWSFERGERWRTLGRHLSLLLFLAPIRVLLDIGLTIAGLWLSSDKELPVILGNLFTTFLSGFPPAPVYYTLIASLGYTAEYYRKYRERELTSSQLEQALARAHLETLKNQLNPHFLFNTLHAIGALSRNDPEATKRMVTLLGGLLRRSLGSANEPQLVPLRQEMDFLKQYLEIEQVLFSDRLRVEYDVPEGLLEVPVPNFLLQPLVENAIQHGISCRSGPGNIWIGARLVGKDLEVTVADDGAGLSSPGPPPEGRGLGINRERLRGLYGENASLSLENRIGGGALARLLLPLPPAGTPPSREAAL